MKTYQVQITKYAQKQIKDIARYVKVKLKNPDAAQKLINDLKTAILTLENMPHRIPLTDEEYKTLGEELAKEAQYESLKEYEEATTRTNIELQIYMDKIISMAIAANDIDLEPEEVIEETTDEKTDETTGETTDEKTEGTPEDTTDETSEEASEETSADTSAESSADTSEETTEDTAA